MSCRNSWTPEVGRRPHRRAEGAVWRRPVTGDVWTCAPRRTAASSCIHWHQTRGKAFPDARTTLQGSLGGRRVQAEPKQWSPNLLSSDPPGPPLGTGKGLLPAKCWPDLLPSTQPHHPPHQPGALPQCLPTSCGLHQQAHSCPPSPSLPAPQLVPPGHWPVTAVKSRCTPCRAQPRASG